MRTIRAAFYYPWFPQTWPEGSVYTPSIGEYDSADSATIAAHVYQMRLAGIAAGIVSWWGPESAYAPRLTQLLTEVEGTGFKWCAYYEAEGYSDPVPTDLHGLFLLAQHPNWLRVRRKPVLFVYADGGDGVDMCQRWHTANQDRFYLVLKVFPGFRTAIPQPDSWHQYAPASAAWDFSPYSFSVSPGFWKSNEAAPRLARDPAEFEADVQAMVASGAKFQLITTFNEYGEGTPIEPTREFHDTYIEILRRNQ